MLEALRSIFKPTPEVIQSATTRGEIAWAESKLYLGDFPKYNPDLLIGTKGHEVYKNMMIDEQVKAVVKFKRDAITSRDWFFELEDDRVSDSESEERIKIYDEMVKQVAGSFKDGLNFIVKAMWQGFSITEKVIDVFEYQGTPYLGLKKLSPKPFDTFKFYTDEYGDIEKLEQQLDGDEQILELEKFVYFVQNPDMDQHYGQSELREAYRSWYSKDIILRLYNMFLERIAGGLVVITPDENGPTISEGSKEYLQIKSILEHIQTQTGILLPKGLKLEIHSPQSTDQFEKAATFHDLQIAKALLVPNLLGVTHTGQTGAYSQSQTQLEAFLWTLDADANRLEEAINEQIFDPLSRDNFADGVGPRFRFKEISDEMKMKIIEKWKELVTSGAVEASDSDENHIRDMMNFPEKGEPLQSPDDTVAPNPGGSSQPNPDEQLDETIMGDSVLRISSDAAFDRAKRRVSISVIDRSTTEMVDRFSTKIADKTADMLAELSLRILEEKLGTPAAETPHHKVGFKKSEKDKIRRVYKRALTSGWDLGVKHAKDEISKARKEEFKFNMRRIDTNAAEFLEANAFRLTGDLTDSMLRSIQAILANAIKYSWTPKETVRKIYDRLTLEGYVFTEVNAEVTGRTVSEILETLGESTGRSIHRIKTGIRTNLFEAINEARYSAYTDPELEGFVEALEYSAILDSRTTDVCRHLDDRVYPVGAPEWDQYRPPNHFNCRSILVPVTIIDTDVVGKDRPGGNSRWSKPPRVEPQTGFGSETG